MGKVLVAFTLTLVVGFAAFLVAALVIARAVA